MEVKGQGTVCYLQKDGLIGSLQDVYYVIPQDQHFEYGATHRERLLDIFKRSATTLEE